jgi:hypothetical protein
MADVAKFRAYIFRHIADMSSDMSMLHQNCRRRHPTNPTKITVRGRDHKAKGNIAVWGPDRKAKGNIAVRGCGRKAKGISP